MGLSCVSKGVATSTLPEFYHPEMSSDIVTFALGDITLEEHCPQGSVDHISQHSFPDPHPADPVWTPGSVSLVQVSSLSTEFVLKKVNLRPRDFVLPVSSPLLFPVLPYKGDFFVFSEHFSKSSKIPA